MKSLTLLLFENTKKWNEETCREEAKKYKTRVEFWKGSGSAYNVAIKNGWLDEYDWFEERKKLNGYWNEATCRDEAKKYTTRKEFLKGSSGAYQVALRNGWLDEYDWFTEKPKHNYWNEETCREEAKKYKTRTEFKKGSGRAYKVALKNKWLDEFFPQKSLREFVEEYQAALVVE